MNTKIYALILIPLMMIGCQKKDDRGSSSRLLEGGVVTQQGFLNDPHDLKGVIIRPTPPLGPISYRLRSIQSVEGTPTVPNAQIRILTTSGSGNLSQVSPTAPIALSLLFTVRDLYEQVSHTYDTGGTITITRVTNVSLVRTNNVIDGNIRLFGSYSLLMNDPDFGRVTFTVPLNNTVAHMNASNNSGVLTFTTPAVIDGLGLFGTVRPAVNYTVRFNIDDLNLPQI